MNTFTFKIAAFLNADKTRVDVPTIIEHGEETDDNYILLVADSITSDGVLVPDAPVKAYFGKDEQLLKVKIGQPFLAKL